MAAFSDGLIISGREYFTCDLLAVHGSLTVMQHVVFVESSSLLIQSIKP